MGSLLRFRAVAFMILAAVLFQTSGLAQGLPSFEDLRAALSTVLAEENGGFGLHICAMGATEIANNLPTTHP